MLAERMGRFSKNRVPIRAFTLLSCTPVPSVDAAVLSFRVPSEHAEEGWWGGRSACQEVGGMVVGKLEWTPVRKRNCSLWVREGQGHVRIVNRKTEGGQGRTVKP